MCKVVFRVKRMPWQSNHRSLINKTQACIIHGMDPTSFGDLVKSIRVERGLSQAELARLIGVSQDVANKAEAGRKSENVALRLIIAGLATPVQIATVTGMSNILALPDSHVGGEANMDPEKIPQPILQGDLLQQLLAEMPESRREAAKGIVILMLHALRNAGSD